jgi:hypothetical protein
MNVLKFKKASDPSREMSIRISFPILLRQFTASAIVFKFFAGITTSHAIFKKSADPLTP